MIFTCPDCEARVSTPSDQDDVIREVECGNCGRTLTVAEHGQRVEAEEGSNRKNVWTIVIIVLTLIALGLLARYVG